MIIQKQQGFTLPNLPSVLIAGGILSYITLQQLQVWKEEIKAEHADNIRTELVNVIDGLQACYDVERDWCDFGEVAANYGGENGVSLTNNNISTTRDGINLRLQLDVNTPELAQQLTRYLPQATSSGSNLSFVIAPPTASHIHQGSIQRYQDDAGFNRNTLEQSLLFNNNDVNEVDLLQSDIGDFENYIVQTQELNDLTVNNQVTIGANAIFSTNPSTLHIDSQNSRFSGNVAIQGNITGNNSNISGVNNFEADSIAGDRLTLTNGDINELSGNNISYTTANIDTINATHYSGNSFQTASLIAPRLQTDNLNANVTADSASMQNLGFRQGSGVDWSYTNVQTSQINANNSNVGAASGTTANYSGQVRGGSFVGGSASFSSLSSSGNVSGGNFYGNNFITGSSSVTANKSLIGTNTSNINSNTTKISSNTSSISSNTAKISSNSGQISSNASQITSNASQITSNASNIANNTSKINANSTKITSNANSISAIDGDVTSARSDLNVLTNKLVNCMDVTQYCYPQTPSVSTSCSGCLASGQRSSFSAVVSANITACRQGCSYTWSISGVSGSCASGNIPKGGSANITCNISKSNVGAGETITGSVSITVKNSHYTSRTDSDSESVSWGNTTPDININNETSLDCSNCGDMDHMSNVKGISTANASATVNYSGKLTDVVITSSITPSFCNWEYGSTLVNGSSSVSKSGASVFLTARVVDTDASASGTIECQADFTITITSSNTSGSAVYSGTLTALASTGAAG